MPGVVSVPEWQSVQGVKRNADAVDGPTAVSRQASSDGSPRRVRRRACAVGDSAGTHQGRTGPPVETRAQMIDYSSTGFLNLAEYLCT